MASALSSGLHTDFHSLNEIASLQPVSYGVSIDFFPFDFTKNLMN